MSESVAKANVLNWLVAAAAVVIIIAGVKAAQSLVIPFLVAAFLAVICTPALYWLKQKGVPGPLALMLVIAGVSLVLLFVIGVASSSISDFIAKSPSYQSKLEAQFDRIQPLLVEIGYIEPGEEADVVSQIKEMLSLGSVFNWFTGLLSSVGGLFNNALLVLLTLIFMLAEASGLPRKLVAITDGRRQLFNESNRVRDAIIQYMSLKTVVSLLTGILASLLVWALDVDYPVLWGLIAFFFNFVPNIGSVIAALPPVLLALIQVDLKCALLMALGYGAINITIGNVIEPRVMGKGLGLSTLVVFLSLVFWGWVLGPVGMLLSVPLTMIVKIALENFEQTRWLAVLLGSNPEPA